MLCTRAGYYFVKNVIWIGKIKIMNKIINPWQDWIEPVLFRLSVIFFVVTVFIGLIISL